MKAFFQSLREILWTLIAVLGAAALFAAVLLPAQFAGKLAGIFDALESEGFDIKIKTPIGEASFDRVKDLQLENTDRQVLELRDELAAARVQIALLDTGPGGPPPPIPAPPDPSDGSGQPEVPEAPVLELAPEEWVVIAGAERDLGSQRSELDALRRAGFSDAVVLEYGGWFQSAVIYPDKAAAEAALADVAAVVGAGSGAYIRALSVMCPAPSEVTGQPDVLVCN